MNKLILLACLLGVAFGAPSSPSRAIKPFTRTNGDTTDPVKVFAKLHQALNEMEADPNGIGDGVTIHIKHTTDGDEEEIQHDSNESHESHEHEHDDDHHHDDDDHHHDDDDDDHHHDDVFVSTKDRKDLFAKLHQVVDNIKENPDLIGKHGIHIHIDPDKGDRENQESQNGQGHAPEEEGKEAGNQPAERSLDDEQERDDEPQPIQ